MQSGENIAGELGDLLAACVNLARFLDVDPEQALHGSCDRFVSRFTRMEELAAASGTALEALSLEEQDKLWEQAKREQRE